IFFLLLLSKKGRKNKANKYLALLILSIVSGCCYYLLLEFRTFYQYPRLSLLPLKLFFLVGPSVYLYVSHSVGSVHSLKQILLHYAPQMAAIIINFVLLLAGISPVSSLFSLYDIYILGFLAQLHAIVYLILTFGLIAKYKQRMKNNLSAISHETTAWLRKLILFVFLLLALMTAYVVVSLLVPGLILNNYMFIYWLLACIFVYWISLSVYNQPDLVQVAEDPPGPANKRVQPDRLNPYLEAIRLSMDKDQLFLKPELTRLALAQHLKITPNTLSHILNKHLGKSFHDFINEYRVNEVKAKIRDAKYLHYTLEGIAYECGFNSKSTFNAIFKKMAGKTPREYKKEVSSF
ncbi:MAG: helix-turn-helix domain-containing protein, partial [Cyclobacteriaceae bacterium]